jgi:hypothetical protein
MGSDFLWSGNHPISGHRPRNYPDLRIGLTPVEAFELALEGSAFAFDRRFFQLPERRYLLQQRYMNSIAYWCEGKEPLGVFAGFRGQARFYPEVVTPGLHRSHLNPNPEDHKQYLRRSILATNVLKQRFWERESKCLTDLEARGVLQHHSGRKRLGQILGPTDILDLTFDVNVAKWFALNVASPDGSYQKKTFTNEPKQAWKESSFVYMILVRPIGEFDLTGIPEAAPLFRGLRLAEWPSEAYDIPPGDVQATDQIQERPDSPPLHTRQVVPPWNLAPLWSTYPMRQKGFGLRGVFPREFDKFGAILMIKVYPYHPTFSPAGWDAIGGPELSISDTRFAANDDSSQCQEFLMPPIEGWVEEALEEACDVVLSHPV